MWAVAAMLLTAACSDVTDVVAITPPPTDQPSPPLPTPIPAAVHDLRGDPSFDGDALDAALATRYGDLWSEIRGASGDLQPLRLAARDDVYHYGRTLQSYVQSVLTTFRVTGDLALLDHVDQIAEVMRTKLRDGWRGTLDGTDGTRDGYLNWVYRYGESTTFEGKDTSRGNEMKTHALVAMIAYALHLNRDLPSPSGRDYGAHADFWLDYLTNHFEAKWRERTGIATGFPFLERPHTHTYSSWMRWHYYMGQLTGDAAYVAEAERMADVLWGELRTVETPSGPAYVWARSVLSEGGSGDYLHPTTYARYVFGDIVELHLEGFHRYADDAELERFARTFTELIVDNGDPAQRGFAADVGGGRTQAGLRSDPAWSRLSPDRYRLSPYALIGAWDASGDIAAVTHEIERSLGGNDTALLNAALFVEAFFKQPTVVAELP
jgi:hypothetical protein